MIRLNPQSTARPPFGHVPFHEICDRLAADGNKWVQDRKVLHHGVLVSARQWTTNKAHKTYLKNKLFPVADSEGGHTLMAHLTFERSFIKNGSTVTLPKGGLIVASRANLVNFIAAVIETPALLKRFCILTDGLYAEAWSPDMSKCGLHPYIDLDLDSMPLCTTFDGVWPWVKETIALMNGSLRSHLADNTQTLQEDVAIFFNMRQKDNGLKFSFHLHWYNICVRTMAELSTLVHAVSKELPKKPLWIEDPDEEEGGRWGERPNGEPLIDTTPYSANEQLFRLPYCGKFGESGTALRPIAVDEEGETTYTYIETEPAMWLDRAFTLTTTPSHYQLVQVEVEATSHIRRRNRLPMNDVVPANLDQSPERREWLRFWEQVLFSMILPNFLKLREKKAAELGARTSMTQKGVQSFDRISGYAASFRLAMFDDSFCEHDTGATPYHHSATSNAITYAVDFQAGKIAQQCVKCQPAHLIWYTFLHSDDLQFTVLDGASSRERQVKYVDTNRHTDPMPFFLKYWQKLICFDTQRCTVYAYDVTTGIWRAGAAANRLLLAMVRETNAAFKGYRAAYNSAIRLKDNEDFRDMFPHASEEEIATQEEKSFKACALMNSKIPNLINLTAAQTEKLHLTLKTQKHYNEVTSMEIHSHLVPLKDKKCINLFTWQLFTIEPEYLFTSVLNAEVIDIRDSTITDFSKWQLDVCCGDYDYLVYKLRIFGLSFTTYNFDRCFYIPLGPSGRNGKSTESYLMALATQHLSPPRGAVCPSDYLTKSAQDGRAANAPDTIMMEFLNKTVVTADECRDVAIDGPLIKSLVSGDTTSARNLYESERSPITLNFTLWIIANKMLKIAYDDKALLDRTRVLPYRAQWTSNVSAALQRTKLPYSNYVFKEDPTFKADILPGWVNAMVTRSLYELHCYFRSLPPHPDHADHRPVRFEAFPIPKVVRDYTDMQIFKEYPLLAFIHRHVGSTSLESDWVPVDTLFTQFRRFGENENSLKVKYQTLAAFTDAIEKEGIFVDSDTRICNGKYIKTPVPGEEFAADNYEPASKRFRT